MASPLIRLTALAGVLSVLLCSCGPAASDSGSSSVPVSSVSSSDSQPSTPTDPSLLTLGYNPSDGWNPYLNPSTLVAQNMGLVFEKLVEIAPDMALSYRIASSIDCTPEAAVIHIRSGCVFADGTPITEQDAAASLEAARQSESYAARFSHVTSIKTEPGMVIVGLSEPDSLFGYLCDIPVFKASETGSASPTPSGRYMYSNSSLLVKNPLCSFPEENLPEQLQLASVASYEEMVSGLTVGSLDLYTVRETGDAAHGVISSQTYFRTNNLIFLGINAEAAPPDSLLAQPAGRVLMSQLLNRRQLAEKSYYSRAWPATGAINNFYPCVMARQKILPEAELTTVEARSQLEAMGYQVDPVSGFFTDAHGQRLSFTLTVYSGSTYKKYTASLIQRQMAACGIEILLDEVGDFNLWAEKIKQGNFQLYIGEVKLYNNMDSSPFFADGAASVGIQQSEALNAAYAAFRQDQNLAGDYEAAFAAEMPYIPLLWQNGILIHRREIRGLQPSISNCFYSLSNLTLQPDQNP